jgi:pimeloyl-ACP methyl ester carboxylesterase
VIAGRRRLETMTYHGDGTRPAIVMLHEGLGSIAMWKDFPERLAARTGCTVVAYSRHGYGSSEPLAAPREPDYMHHEAQVVLPELLQALDVERPIIFGHSDGASIALIYAGTRPDGARALVLEAPHVFVEELSIRSIAAARETWATTSLRERLGRYHADVDGAFTGWNDIWLDARFRDWNIEAYADAVRVPVLVVQGEGDEYGTIAQVESIAARVPGTETMLIPGAGHSPHRDAPDAVLERVAAFVDRL